MKFIEFCFKNKILLAIFPPRATATLQPFNVGVFGPLVQAYSQELSKFMDQMLGGRLVVSGVIYWSQCVEGLISVGVVYIGC